MNLRAAISCLAAAFVAGATLLLVGCGGSDKDTQGTTQISPGGIWDGFTGTDEYIVGLITEDGEFHFINIDTSAQFAGSLSVSGHAVSGSYTVYLPITQSWPDGSTSATGILSGTIQAQSTLNGTVTITTANGAVETHTIALDYNGLYDRPSSLGAIAGNFRAEDGTVVNIGSGGSLFAQNADTGCAINGTVSLIDSQYNAYRGSWTYASCTGDFTALNGLTVSGIGTLDNADPNYPEGLIFGATAERGSTRISIVQILERI